MCVVKAQASSNGKRPTPGGMCVRACVYVEAGSACVVAARSQHPVPGSFPPQVKQAHHQRRVNRRGLEAGGAQGPKTNASRTGSSRGQGMAGKAAGGGVNK